MASEWQTVPLDSLIEPDRAICYGIVQPGPPAPNGVPIVRVGDVRDGRIAVSSPLLVAPSIEAAYSRSRLTGGELLLTLVGTVGESAIAPASLAGWNTARAVAVIPVMQEVGAYWVRLALYAPGVRQLIDSRLNTTVQATLNLGDVAKLPIVLPPAREREAIAAILGALDDKIELNRRMNESLEGLARALFKSWFVDFEPVRAKAAGRKPVGMDAATAEMFPSAMSQTQYGPIPVGWIAGSLRDAADIHDSKRVPLSSSERAERRGHYPYYGAASAMDRIDDFLFDGVYLLVGEDGSVVNTDDSPVLQYVWGQFWVNNHAHVLSGRNGFATEHLYQALRNVNIRPYVTGAVQPKLNQANLFRVPLIVPPEPVRAAFSEHVRTLYAGVRALARESQTLADLRDTLLPKLLSGELRVRGAMQPVME